MKQVTLRLDEATYKSAKIESVLQDKSFMQYIVDLIKQDLITKKSKHGKFGDERVYSEQETQ